MRRAFVLLLCSLSCSACDAPSRPTPRPRALDKQALYGDASLLPTREGERARRELALAGELSASLALLGLDETRVDVELGERPRAIVVARRELGDERPELERSIHELAAAIVSGVVEVHVQLLEPASAAAPPPPRTPDPWALALTCLGLGASLGVTGERLLARRRAHARDGILP